ncbi:MAG: PH domain-containing protein [Candidatus Korarchaeota archaeon]|nr:PH domain-containing protein [Candidatus Korarchaeota archaeon]NIU84137.1 PH domain-containing protein [Candidatus Thorarchaeota archaeon]NIW14282.1 PH domain-containing protein [Candidatus Thorarchaeota archaeon]NIW52379.1 PH domain-containing protein [Candidatus Korarchaeota archaeon]
MIVPALLFSILKIRWNWVISFVILSSIGTFLFYQFDATLKMLFYATIGLGVLGLILSDVYRTSHKYILTSFRIITKIGFINASTRSLPYSKITDLVEEQGFLGKIFNFGHLFPLTASRMGTGSKTAEVKVGTGVGAQKGKTGAGVGIAIEGGQSVIVPQSRTYYILYGIPKPERIKQIIITRMREKEPAYATETQTEVLAEKLDLIIEKLDYLNKNLQ